MAFLSKPRQKMLDMNETQDALKTFPSRKRDIIHFQPEPWLMAQLESITKSHKLNMTDAIHYGFEQWNILREQKSSASSPETAPTPWEEITCRLLVQLPKIGHECLCLHPVIRVLHPLMSSKICEICQKEAEEREQIEKTLARNNLNPRTNHKIAQLIHGLEVERDTERGRSQSKEQQAITWMKRHDERGVTIKTKEAQMQELKQENQALKSRETVLCNREIVIEKTKQEYSEQREALQELPTLRTKVGTLETENAKLDTDNGFLARTSELLRKQLEEKSKESARALQQACDSFMKEKRLLEAKIENLKETTRIPCRDKSVVPLTFCMKECEKFKNQSCESYSAIWRLSTIPIQEVETEATKP